MFIDLDSPEEVPLVKELIVVVEKDGGVVHGGETKHWDAKLRLGVERDEALVTA